MATCRDGATRRHRPPKQLGKAQSEIPCRVSTTCPVVPRGTAAVRLISGKPARHLANGNPEGSPSDPVTTDPKGEARRVVARPQDHATCNTPALIQGKSSYGAAALDPWYVTGLTEGEGCFCISFSLRSRLRARLEVRPSFSLSLNEKDGPLLADLQAFFDCGWIRQSRSDRTHKYEVRSISDLLSRVLPHFERFPLAGSKARSFRGFSLVCWMIGQGDHLERQGLMEIVRIAYEINLGKRRYSQAALLRELGEVKG
jgi:hypothetical protein